MPGARFLWSPRRVNGVFGIPMEILDGISAGRGRKKRRTSQNKSIAEMVRNQGLGLWQRRRRYGACGRPHRRHKGSPHPWEAPVGVIQSSLESLSQTLSFSRTLVSVVGPRVPASLDHSAQNFSLPRLSLSIRDDDAHATADACLDPACSPRCRQPWRNPRRRADAFQGQGWRCEWKSGYLWRASSSIAHSQRSDFDCHWLQIWSCLCRSSRALPRCSRLAESI